MIDQKSQNRTSCPYLGLIGDPKTTTLFPSSGNACQLVNPPAPVILNYQSSYCLSQSHIECPGYVSGWQDGFPKELLGYQETKKTSFPIWTLIVGTVILIVVLVIGALSQIY
ncbi:hypothetical protein [Vibrio sp.]|uniref:hypothetical protein n=1 Tax=Vibrio sp. TaxID=678 RepID=UPI003D140D3F